MENCLFCSIRDVKIPAHFVYQDDTVMVFPDIHPQKPVHLLIVPKKHISEFAAIEEMLLMKDISEVVQKMITENELEHKGYRIQINGGGIQDVDHLHVHLLGPMK
jgi:histidine triad (HIT) family protein